MKICTLFIACDGRAGLEFGWVRDSLMSASTEQEYAEASRARLNAVTLSPIVSGLSEGFSGGWKSQPDDPNPWLMVDLENPYVFTQVAIQGHDVLPYWVTRFSLNYSDDNSLWYQHLNSSTGTFVYFVLYITYYKYDLVYMLQALPYIVYESIVLYLVSSTQVFFVKHICAT